MGIALLDFYSSNSSLAFASHNQAISINKGHHLTFLFGICLFILVVHNSMHFTIHATTQDSFYPSISCCVSAIACSYFASPLPSYLYAASHVPRKQLIYSIRNKFYNWWKSKYISCLIASPLRSYLFATSYV